MSTWPAVLFLLSFFNIHQRVIIAFSLLFHLTVTSASVLRFIAACEGPSSSIPFAHMTERPQRVVFSNNFAIVTPLRRPWLSETYQVPLHCTALLNLNSQARPHPTHLPLTTYPMYYPQLSSLISPFNHLNRTKQRHHGSSA